MQPQVCKIPADVQGRQRVANPRLQVAAAVHAAGARVGGLAQLVAQRRQLGLLRRQQRLQLRRLALRCWEGVVSGFRVRVRIRVRVRASALGNRHGARMFVCSNEDRRPMPKFGDTMPQQQQARQSYT